MTSNFPYCYQSQGPSRFQWPPNTQTCEECLQPLSNSQRPAPTLAVPPQPGANHQLANSQRPALPAAVPLQPGANNQLANSQRPAPPAVVPLQPGANNQLANGYVAAVVAPSQPDNWESQLNQLINFQPQSPKYMRQLLAYIEVLLDVREAEDLVTEKKRDLKGLYSDLLWEQQRQGQAPAKEDLEKHAAKLRTAIANKSDKEQEPTNNAASTSTTDQHPGNVTTNLPSASEILGILSAIEQRAV